MIKTTDTNSRFEDRELPDGERLFTVSKITDGPKNSDKWYLTFEGGSGAQILWPNDEGPLLRLLGCTESKPGVFEWETDLIAGRSFIATVSTVEDKKKPGVMRKKMSAFKKSEKEDEVPF